MSSFLSFLTWLHTNNLAINLSSSDPITLPTSVSKVKNEQNTNTYKVDRIETKDLTKRTEGKRDGRVSFDELEYDGKLFAEST